MSNDIHATVFVLILNALFLIIRGYDYTLILLNDNYLTLFVFSYLTEWVTYVLKVGD